MIADLKNKLHGAFVLFSSTYKSSFAKYPFHSLLLLITNYFNACQVGMGFIIYGVCSKGIV